MAGIIATNKSTGTHTPAPIGNHVARCVEMIQLGTLTEEINGKTKELHKVRLTWELPTELHVFSEEKGEQPHLISQEYTLSMNEKANLRKHLESWRGKAFTEQEADAFDITKLLGVPCMLNVIHETSKKGNTYAKIASVSSMPKGLKCPDQITPLRVLAYPGEGEKFDWTTYNSLPDFIKDKIKSTPEFRALQQPNVTQAKPEPETEKEPESDLPF